jgi:RNA polymerase sigma factor (sigma-70 family)
LLDDERRSENEEGESLGWEDWLPSSDADPEGVFAHNVLSAALADALAELPEEQQLVFVAHEIEGRSFKEISQETGVSVNTLLSRKHYAVLHLRRKLEETYQDFRG